MKSKVMLPSSSSLFHYTRKKSTFRKILSESLMYVESIELCPNDDLSTSDIYKNNGVFITPIICFCDIPVFRSMIHRKKYGNFAIGLDKDFMKRKLTDNLNPVIYVSSQKLSSYFSSFREKVEVLRADFIEHKFKIGLEEDRTMLNRGYDIMNYLYSYFKPCDFYDEREWRAIYPMAWGHKFLSWNGKHEALQENMKGLKEICKATNTHITFEVNELLEAISHIIIPKDKDISSWVKFILNEKQTLFGCDNVPMNIRHVLASKLTSFERIEKDY